MGKVLKTIADELISPAPDRNANRVRVYQKDNGEVVVHFRNFKLMLFSHEVQEWKEGFTKALAELRAKDYLKNDL